MLSHPSIITFKDLNEVWYFFFFCYINEVWFLETYLVILTLLLSTKQKIYPITGLAYHANNISGASFFSLSNKFFLLELKESKYKGENPKSP